MAKTSTDRIEKKILLRAPRPRVWRALTDSKEFGSWFGVNIQGKFAAGKRVVGNVTIKGYEHVLFEVVVEKIDEPQYFAYRWHPYAIDSKIDYSKEPMTLVEFRLDETKEGTLLTVTESGFDKLPANRRDEAFRMNEGGWAGQLENIEKHVAV
jgi:uncharacterized protein YndB with AHSA1/START domain